jgi:hypothetical protein
LIFCGQEQGKLLAVRQLFQEVGGTRYPNDVIVGIDGDVLFDVGSSTTDIDICTIQRSCKAIIA